jgi:hypothetical protein
VSASSTPPRHADVAVAGAGPTGPAVAGVPAAGGVGTPDGSTAAAHPRTGCAGIGAPVAYQTRSAQGRSPLAFFALTAALFAPFPVLATFLHVPGLPKNAPVTDFGAAFAPAAAALILVHRAEGPRGVRRLLRRLVDHRRIRNKRWCLPVVSLPEASLGATYGLAAVTGWQFQRQPELSAAMMLLFVPVYLLAAVDEELGWSG